MPIFSLLIAPLSAFLIGLCAIRTVRRVALAVGFVDRPDLRRKLHAAPVALGGGIAVWLATWSGWGIGLLACLPGTGESGDAGWFYVALGLASSVILGLGVLDDRYGLRGRHKLAGQVVAAAILVGLGLRIDAWSGFGVEIELGIFAYPIAILWVVLVVNAFNLMDGMDGFCGCLGLVASLAIAFLSYRSGRVGDALVGLALAGALAAFLGRNLPPAGIYLGDAGSMTLGMILAALSVRAFSDGPGTAVSLPPLVALLALPLLDVAAALCRRRLTGRSLYHADRGHIHHCLSNRLGSPVAALGAATGLAIVGAVGATLTKGFGMGDHMAVLAVAITVGLLVFTNTFGRSELRLLSFRLEAAVAPFLTWGGDRRGAVRQECHLHGLRDWTGVWGALIRDVEASGVCRIEFAIDMPAAGETYHGLWSLPPASGDEPSWSVVHNLYVGGAHAGILHIAGSADACRSRYLDKVGELVRVLEIRLASDFRPSVSAAPSPGRDGGCIVLSKLQPEHALACL